MADYEKLQQKDIELDLSNVPASDKTAAKEAVANYVIDEISSRVAKGYSPVAGYGKFKKLSEAYADREKGGDPNPNLYLQGDMLSSLGYKNTAAGIAVGIMDEDQRPKADGHNNFSGDSKLPERRFIAGADETFLKSIMDEIPKIISEFEAPSETNTKSKNKKNVFGLEVISSTFEPLSVTLSAFIKSPEEALLNDLLKKVFK